jgi:hypothetical protein
MDEPLAGKSTLNRLGLSDGTPNRYKKIIYWKDAIDELFVDVFLEAFEQASEDRFKYTSAAAGRCNRVSVFQGDVLVFYQSWRRGHSSDLRGRLTYFTKTRRRATWCAPMD